MNNTMNLFTMFNCGRISHCHRWLLTEIYYKKNIFFYIVFYFVLHNRLTIKPSVLSVFCLKVLPTFLFVFANNSH